MFKGVLTAFLEAAFNGCLRRFGLFKAVFKIFLKTFQEACFTGNYVLRLGAQGLSCRSLKTFLEACFKGKTYRGLSEPSFLTLPHLLVLRLS